MGILHHIVLIATISFSLPISGLSVADNSIYGLHHIVIPAPDLEFASHCNLDSDWRWYSLVREEPAAGPSIRKYGGGEQLPCKYERHTGKEGGDHKTSTTDETGGWQATKNSTTASEYECPEADDLYFCVSCGGSTNGDGKCKGVSNFPEIQR
jgi:hypothetical protein